jgi:sialic acid synthase SpsE
VSNYPAEAADCNLRAIPTMAAAFDVPIGFSDHTLGEHAAIAAVALGAAVIEKHLTVDTSLPGPDHRASLDPVQCRAFVAAIRDTEAALGGGLKRRAPSEDEIAQLGRRSLYWARALERGARIVEQDLTALRPGTGMSPNRWRAVVGRTLRHDVAAGSPVAADDVE